MKDVVPLLKHSPSAQNPEVLEEITVQREPLVAGLVEAALDTEGGPRHQLLIGPRGIGKTHILTLVASRLRGEEKRQPLAVAWLKEDPWPIRSYEKFLAEIVSRLADDLDDPSLRERAEEIRSGGGDAALEGEQLLHEAIGNARLVLLVENLDEIFRKIGDEGQARFRAFAEDWRQMLIIATAPQLFEGVQLHESPFYGFFAITHLEELSLASARELMRRIAELRGDAKLAEFLRTDIATRRLAAIEALAGGHPRVWLLLSGCVSIEAIDDLVPLFLEAIDDLTPYYQARLRELGDQQQEVVVLLGEAGGALSNRELAERSGLAQNQVATLVRQLDERGYLRRATVPKEIAGGDERMSYWELREPLMRLCLDVKQSRGEPLRMVVEFLRAWYGPRLLDELAALPDSAQLAATYAIEALRSLDDFPVDDLFEGTPSEIVARAERGLSLLPDRLELRMAKAAGLRMQGRLEEAEEEYERLIAEEKSERAKLVVRHQLFFVRRANGKPVDEERLVTELQKRYEEQPEDPLIAELAGKVLTDLGRTEAALALLPRAIELNPDDADLLDAYGTCLARLQRHEEALAAFDRAIEMKPGSPSTHGRRGTSLGNLGRLEEALESFKEVARLAPEDARAYSSIGVALISLGRIEEALAALDQAIELDPDSAQIEGRRGLVLRRLGRPRESLKAFDRAIELDPEEPLLHQRRGAALNALGRYEEAVEACAKAHELGAGRAPLYTNWGIALVNLDRYEEALGAFSKAHELDPENPAIQANRGGMLVQLGHYEEAVDALRASLEAYSDDSRIWNNLGGALGNLERSEEAVEAFRKAAELNPEDSDIQTNLGIALMTLDRYEEASAAFAKAIEADPHRATAWANRGATLANLGRYEEAAESLAKALELTPGSVDLLEAAGVVFNHLGRPEEALEVFTAAAEIEPQKAELHRYRADTLREIGELAEAERAIERAIELDPEEPLYLFSRAEIGFMRDELEAALEQLREALRLWSENPDDPPGEPDAICQALWRRHEAGEDVRWVVGKLAKLYSVFDATDDLGRALVAAVPLLAAPSVPLESARSWLAAWEEAPDDDALEIPLAMLRAAVEWKKDRDRSPLLSLPQEQREILTGLLADTEDGP